MLELGIGVFTVGPVFKLQKLYNKLYNFRIKKIITLQIYKYDTNCKTKNDDWRIGVVDGLVEYVSCGLI